MKEEQSEPSDGDASPDPLQAVGSRDWREFRAALVAGSTEALEKAKETAYRTGHWAHSVRCFQSMRGCAVGESIRIY